MKMVKRLSAPKQVFNIESACAIRSIVAGFEQFTSKRADNRCRLALLTVSSFELLSSMISSLSLPISSVLDVGKPTSYLSNSQPH